MSRAGPPRRRAIAALTLVAALLLAVLASLPVDVPRPGAGSAAVIAGIVEGMRHGDGFYALAGGGMQGETSAFAVPLPTLAVIAAALPAPALAAMLWVLAGAAILGWEPRLRALPRGERIAATAALLLGCGAAVRPGLALAPELWAGLLVALSIARRRPGDPIEAIGFGVAATLIAPAAAPFLALMAAFGWAEGHRREAGGWLLALALFALVLAAHVRAVVPGMQAGTAVADAVLGPGFAVQAIGAATLLFALPAAASAVLVALSLVGWAGQRDPAGRRVAAVLGACALALAIAPDPDEGWALLAAPLSLVGLAFVAGQLRTLARAALDRRRITVRRVVR